MSRVVRPGSGGVIVAGALALVVAIGAPRPVRGQEPPEPPGGELTVDGIGPFTGTIGSYCVMSASEFFCSDAPLWIVPATGAAAGANASLRFGLADGSEITSWSARYADAGDASGEGLPLGAGSDGDPRVAFSGPPAGDWVIRVSVQFDCCDAQYFFRLQAGLPPTDSAPAAAPPATPSHDELLLLLLAFAGGVAGWRTRRRTMLRRAVSKTAAVSMPAAH